MVRQQPLEKVSRLGIRGINFDCLYPEPSSALKVTLAIQTYSKILECVRPFIINLNRLLAIPFTCAIKSLRIQIVARIITEEIRCLALFRQQT